MKDVLFAAGKNQANIMRTEVGSKPYALQLDYISEVVVAPKTTFIPDIQSFIEGIADNRGKSMLIINLEKRFGINSPINLNYKYCMVFKKDLLQIGVLCAEAPSTLTVRREQVEDTPEALNQLLGNQQFLLGVARLNNELLPIIDIFELLNEAILQSALGKAGA